MEFETSQGFSGVNNQEQDMSNFSNVIGIDVSKKKVDIFSVETSFHKIIANNEESLREELSKFSSPERILVVIENTGAYERKAMKILLEIGFNVHRTNNVKFKNFCELKGIKAKTDKVDAKSLARYGKETTDPLELYEPMDEKKEKLRQLSLYLIALKEKRAHEKSRLQSPGCDLIAAHVQGIIDIFDQKILAVQKEIDELLDTDDDMKGKVEALTQYRGVGKTTAINMIVHMPELGKANKQKITCLGRLAPHKKESGQKKGHKKVKRDGRPIIREILFMPVMAAIRVPGEIRDFYNQLRSRGKKPMIAIVACMRKILVQLNAIMKKYYKLGTI
jgi:transposase